MTSPSPLRGQILADPDLGKIYDTLIAKRHGCSPRCVLDARRSAGIPAPPRSRPTRDQDGNHVFFRSPVLRAIAADPDLGKMPDGAIADRNGCNKNAVHRVRNLLGIPAHHDGGNRGGARWKVVGDPDLGEVSPSVLARKHAVRPEAVTQAAATVGVRQIGNAPSPVGEYIMDLIADRPRSMPEIRKALRARFEAPDCRIDRVTRELFRLITSNKIHIVEEWYVIGDSSVPDHRARAG